MLAWLFLATVLPTAAVEWPEPVADISGEPYRYVGLIYDTNIYASAFVAGDERLLFTGAHIFFNPEGEMEDAGNFRFALQFNQSEAPGFEGKTVRAAIVYTGQAGYAGMLEQYGENSEEGFSQDIAVAYGYQPMSDGGAMPFLNDGPDRLKSTLAKKLVGYPIGLYLDQIRPRSSANRFRMHDTLPSIGRFRKTTSGDDRLLEGVAESRENTTLVSIPGNSGGPLVVETSPGIWGAAGILVAGNSEVQLTPSGSSHPMWAGISLIRSLHADDWSALVEPALEQSTGKPVFAIHPVDTTILPGDSGELYGFVEGYGDITYQWFKNDKEFAGQTRYHIYFDNAQPPQAGIYELRATNHFGTTRSAQAVLTIPTGPTITEQPQNFVLSYGSQGTIRFKFYAAGPYEIRFYRNGEKLPPWLNLPEYRIYDAGRYHATVTNAWGQVQTDTITVEVELDSTFFLKQPKGGDRAAGKSIDLSVRTVDPNVRMQWYKDGEILPGAVSNSLNFIVRGPEDEGAYYIIVETGKGLLQSNEAKIRVEEAPPSFVDYTTPTYARTGVSIRLGVNIVGTRPLTYQWSFKGEELPGANGPYLDITNLSASDFGNYACRVSNRLGSIEHEQIQLKTGLDPFWTPLKIPTTLRVTDFAQNDSIGVATTLTGTLLTTLNGTDWTEHELAPFAHFEGVAWGNGRFVATGGGIVATSPDGVEWDITTTPLGLRNIHHGNGLFLASEERYGLLTSTNGIDWNHVLSAPFNRTRFVHFATGNGRFIASSERSFATSPNGVDWSLREWQSLPGNLVEYHTGALVFGNGHFTVVADSLRLLSSVDGQDWTLLSSAEADLMLATDGNLFVAGTFEGLEMISSDNLIWESLVARSLHEVRGYYVFKGRILAFSWQGSGVISPDLSSPFRVLRPPVSQHTFDHQSARLEVTHLPNSSISYQWFKGGHDPTAIPVVGATSSSLEVAPTDSGSYWVRLTRGSDTWDSEPVQVDHIAPGFFMAADEDEGTAVHLSADGTVSLISYDHAGRTISTVPAGSVESGDADQMPGSFYWRVEGRLLFRPIEQGGRFESDAFFKAEWTGSVYQDQTIPRIEPDLVSHRASGYYRFALTGKPFCEGSAIVDENGTAVIVMHTTDQLVSGSGGLSNEYTISLGEATNRRLQLTFDPERATVSGTYTEAGEVFPVNGMRRGTETRAGLANLSSRGFAQTGDGILIAGLVLQGPGSAKLLIRGIGPALTGFGVSNALDDPRLKVISNDVLIAENDNWGRSADLAALKIAHQKAGAFALEAGSKDAALITMAEPGGFTVHVEGGASGTGNALAEVYHLRDPTEDRTSAPRLLNLSIRGIVDGPEKPLVIGFVIDGDRPRQVFVRAIGPSLAFYGLSNYLPDPQLTLFQGNQILTTAPYPRDVLPEYYRSNLYSIARTVGAFPPIKDEPALAVWLDPGPYTAVVQPGENAKGIALVEIYEIPFDAPSN